MFEAQGSDGRPMVSPGGFEFGIQGWIYAQPVPTSITFFLDNTAIVLDQYGRPIRGALLPSGEQVMFADRPPEGDREGNIYPRPQFATHAKVIEALTAEGINWLAYEVRWRGRDQTFRQHTGLSLEQANQRRAQLCAEGNTAVTVVRAIQTAGWPQLPYEQLKKLPELPPTPADELRKIRDPKLRKDALRARREADEAHAQERASEE